MQVTVETSEGLERRLRVELPEERVQGEVEKRLQKLAKQVKIRGFRPGKVPMKVVQQRYGRQVRNEVVGDLVQSSFFDALTRENLRPAGSPTIDPLSSDPGAGVQYTATFDVYPDIELPPLESVKIARPTAEIRDTDVDAMIETLRRQRRQWQEVERAAGRSDRVVIDFEGSVDGRVLDDATGTEFPVELDGEKMIPGFAEGLEGLRAGDERTLELTFPEGYRARELAAKPVSFQIKVHRVEEPSLPDVDDEFARSYGVQEGGAEALRVEVGKYMARELADTLRAVTKQRTMDALMVGQSIELPRALVREESERALQRRRLELAHSGVNPDEVELDAAAFEAQARVRVGLGLLLSEIIKSNDIKPDPRKVRARIETLAATYEQPDEVINWYYGDPERLADIETSVLEDQVVDWVLERADVTEEGTSFDALMKPGQTT